MLERNSEAVEYALREARENDVKFIRLWFTDILGNIKGFAITVEELENALTRGMSFDGSAIEGYAREDERDLYALPDPTTFNILPWRPKTNAVARMFCDIVTPDEKPFEGDPRNVLRRNLQRASDKGYTYYVAPEIEYFYFRDEKGTDFLDSSEYFDQVTPNPGTDLRRETVLTLEELGIPVESSHHEAAPSQHEIDLRHTDALTMADTVMTYKLVVKEIASSHGYFASFMPKPASGINGNGMHTQMSLSKGDENIFYGENDPHRLSDTGRQFCAGLLRHAREITLVTNQWVNSYKRLEPGFEAPIYISWAKADRSDLIRVHRNPPLRTDSSENLWRPVHSVPYLRIGSSTRKSSGARSTKNRNVLGALNFKNQLLVKERSDRKITGTDPRFINTSMGKSTELFSPILTPLL